MNKYLRLCFAASMASCLCFGQTKFVTTKSGKVYATSTRTLELTGDGGAIWSSETIYTRTHDRITNYHRYTATGECTEILENLDGRGHHVSIQAAFNSKGVLIRILADGKQYKKTVAYPGGKNPRHPDEFWFLRGHPKLGAVVETYRLDVVRRKWKPQKITYTGDEAIVLDGRGFSAHKLEIVYDGKPETVWLDNKGLTLRRVSQTAVTDRVVK